MAALEQMVKISYGQLKLDHWYRKTFFWNWILLGGYHRTHGCVPTNEIMWASVAELHYHQPQDLYQYSQNKVENVGCNRNKLKIEITILR